MLMHAICLDLQKTVKRKLSILREHCKSVGRDYDSILKTKLGFVVIDNDKKMVEKRVQLIISRGIPKEQVGEFIIYGTPDDVLKQMHSYRSWRFSITFDAASIGSIF